jgi:hypothetical protein
MKKIITTMLIFCTVLIANAQQNNAAKQSLKEALIGTWTLVSVDNIYLTRVGFILTVTTPRDF